MGHSLGDGIIVASITVGVIIYLLLKFLERRRRLEIVHGERVAAMDKGIPLPELPLETKTTPPPNPHVPLMIGIVLAGFGFGAMIAMSLVEAFRPAWPMPLPIAFMGLGLVLYHFLTAGGQDSESAARRGN